MRTIEARITLSDDGHYVVVIKRGLPEAEMLVTNSTVEASEVVRKILEEME